MKAPGLGNLQTSDKVEGEQFIVMPHMHFPKFSQNTQSLELKRN
jgi:hypothetical protein